MQIRRPRVKPPSKHGSCSGKSISLDPTADAENVGRLNFGVQLYIIAAAVPDVTLPGQKIVHLIGIALDRSKLINRNVDKRMLFSMWIEIHHYQNDVVARGGHFPVKENRVIVGVIKTQVIVKTERTVRPPDLI